MSEVLSGYWTTPLLILALVLLIVDVLILVAFILWAITKFVKQRHEKARPEKQIIKQESSPPLEWNTSSKVKDPDFEIPTLLVNENSDDNGSLIGRRSPSTSSISTRDLDTTLYSADEGKATDTSVETDVPKLIFSFYYYKESQQLVVSLLQGKGITPDDGQEESQISISVILLSDGHIQHSFANKGPEPTFKEDFYFTIPDDKLTDRQIKFNVWLADRFSRKVPFGDLVVPLGSFMSEEGILAVEGTGDIEGRVRRKRKLSNETPKGEILLSICYLPSAERLNIVVIKAKDLSQLEEQEKEIFVKVSAVTNKKVVKNKKLQAVRKSPAPIFNEAVSFNLAPGELSIEQMNIVVSVYVTRSLGPRRLLGRTVLGNISEATSDGIDHWNRMLNSPRSAIARWQELM